MQHRNDAFRSETWTGRAARIVVDDSVVPCAVAAEPEWLNNDVGRLTLTVAASSATGLSDYRGVTTVEIDFGAAGTTLIGGFVETAAWEGRKGTVILASALHDLANLRSGGFASRRVPPLEVFWATMRLAGWPANRLNVEGMRLDTLETFTVATVVEGVYAPDMFNVGPVLFSSDPRFASAELPPGDEELLGAFRSGPVWAFTLVKARLCLDAETSGVRRIDAALAWLMVAHGCGAPVGPGAQPMPFTRASSRGRPRRSGLIYAEGASSKRQWLRGGIVPAERPSLGDSEITRQYALGQELPDHVVEAALCWQRAAESTEQFAIVSALCEVVECLTARTSAPKLFPPAELRRIRAALPTDVSEEQAKRLGQVLGEVNRPPLRLKFEHLLGAFSIPHTAKELEALQAVRDARNDFVHGRGRRELDPLNVELAMSFVARVILRFGDARS